MLTRLKKFQKQHYFVLLFTSLILLTACSEDDETNPVSDDPKSAIKGTLLLSSASDFNRYDFATTLETSLFDGGSAYTVSSNGEEFVWYDNEYFEGTSTIQIHEVRNPENYQTINFDFNLEETPKIAGGTDYLGTLLPSPDEPYARNHLYIFDRQGNIISQLDHVKDFVFSPDGEDIIVSIESREANLFAIAMIENWQDANNRNSVVIREFADYDQLPTYLSISADGSRLAYTFLQHIYILPVEADAQHQQLTTSPNHEEGAAWSPDGNFLAFYLDPMRNCGDVYVVPTSNITEPIPIISGGNTDSADDNFPFPIKLQTVEGLDVVSCGGGPGIYWFEEI